MRTVRSLVSFLTAFIAAKEVSAKPFTSHHPHPIVRDVQNPPVADSQNFSAPAFIGSTAKSQPLAAKPIFTPNARGAHEDGGNSRTDDWSGPLGNNPEVHGNSDLVAYMFWEDATADSYVLASLSCGGSSTEFCLAALDPDTLEPIVQWSAENRTAISNYWQIVDGLATIPTSQGFIVQVQATTAADGSVSFEQTAEYDVSSALAEGNILATTGADGNGNIWFTSTAVPLLGLPGVPTSGVGYVDANGTMHTIALENSLIENGVALNDGTLYVVTGPAGTADHANATGNFYAFQVGTDGVKIVYNETYDAGSGIKPGGLSRGSGSSVSLIGQKYVAITDNADVQLHVLVYRQAGALDDGEKAPLACSYPIFPAGSGANEASLTTYFDGTTYSATIPNCYNSSWTFGGQEDINGPQNNMTISTPGVTRVDITDDGECSFVWNLDVRATMTTLSTGNGLFYTYTQDEDLANQGLYAWYFVAYDWRTGEEVWRAHVGNGGVYNTGLSAIQLGPNGRIYEGLTGGVAWLQDASS